MNNYHLNKENSKLSLIDKKTWKRITVHLKDDNENIYNVAEIAEQLIKYIEQETKKDNSSIINQIYPIMSQLLVPNLSLTMGDQLANVFLNGHLTMTALLDSMLIAFLFLKYIQQKELKIVTQSEPLTKEEISIIKQREDYNQTAPPITQLLGVSPEELVRTLYDNNQLSEEALKSLIGNQENN